MTSRLRSAQRDLALFVSCSALFLSSCGGVFQPLVASCESEPCAGKSGSLTPEVPATPGNGSDAFKNLQLDGSITSGRFMDTPVVSLDKLNKAIRVRLPMIANPLLVLAGDIPLPQLPGGKLSWDKLPDGSPALVLSIPLDRFLKGLDLPRADRLPNGEPLPAVPGGELPSFAVSLIPGRDVRASIYLGPSVVAIFVNTPFDPFIRTPAIPIRDQQTMRTLGYFAIIPAVQDFEGGFFISAMLPADIARIIDDAI